MILAQVFEGFVEASAVSLMVRGVLEAVLSPEKLDELFEKTSPTQYSRERLFSTVVQMINTVACEIRPSIHAVFEASASKMSLSITSVEHKLNGIEPNVSAELVRQSAATMEAVIRHLQGSKV